MRQNVSIYQYFQYLNPSLEYMDDQRSTHDDIIRFSVYECSKTKTRQKKSTELRKTYHNRSSVQISKLYHFVVIPIIHTYIMLFKTIGELKSVQKDLLQQRKMTTIILEIVQETR